MIADTRAGPFAAIAPRWTLVLIVVYRTEAIAASAPKHLPFFFTWDHSLPSVSIQKLRTVPLGTGSFYGSTGKFHMVAPLLCSQVRVPLKLPFFRLVFTIIYEVLYST